MKVKLWFLLPALFLLVLFFVYFLFISKNSSFVYEYTFLQKDLFFFLNFKLSQYPNLQFNLTQFGDVLISFSLLSIFIVYAPKLWEVLFTSSILSLLTSAVLKRIFAMPRPAAIFNVNDFEIIGRTLSGNTSLPSGHIP